MRKLLWLAIGIFAGMLFGVALSYAAPAHHYHYAEYGQVVSHPAGCPGTQFCGCGVCVHLLGHPCVRGGLAISDNWRRLPRAACAPGRAAVWSGHVAAIESCYGDGTAMLYDPNSGGHLTRIHRASLAGATIVAP